MTQLFRCVAIRGKSMRVLTALKIIGNDGRWPVVAPSSVPPHTPPCMVVCVGVSHARIRLDRIRAGGAQDLPWPGGASSMASRGRQQHAVVV